MDLYLAGQLLDIQHLIHIVQSFENEYGDVVCDQENVSGPSVYDWYFGKKLVFLEQLLRRGLTTVMFKDYKGAKLDGLELVIQGELIQVRWEPVMKANLLFTETELKDIPRLWFRGYTHSKEVERKVKISKAVEQIKRMVDELGKVITKMVLLNDSKLVILERVGKYLDMKDMDMYNKAPSAKKDALLWLWSGGGKDILETQIEILKDRKVKLEFLKDKFVQFSILMTKPKEELDFVAEFIKQTNRAYTELIDACQDPNWETIMARTRPEMIGAPVTRSMGKRGLGAASSGTVPEVPSLVMSDEVKRARNGFFALFLLGLAAIASQQGVELTLPENALKGLGSKLSSQTKTGLLELPPPPQPVWSPESSAILPGMRQEVSVIKGGLLGQGGRFLMIQSADEAPLQTTPRQFVDETGLVQYIPLPPSIDETQAIAIMDAFDDSENLFYFNYFAATAGIASFFVYLAVLNNQKRQDDLVTLIKSDLEESVFDEIKSGREIDRVSLALILLKSGGRLKRGFYRKLKKQNPAELFHARHLAAIWASALQKLGFKTLVTVFTEPIAKKIMLIDTKPYKFERDIQPVLSRIANIGNDLVSGVPYSEQVKAPKPSSFNQDAIILGTFQRFFFGPVVTSVGDIADLYIGPKNEATETIAQIENNTAIILAAYKRDKTSLENFKLSAKIGGELDTTIEDVFRGSLVDLSNMLVRSIADAAIWSYEKSVALLDKVTREGVITLDNIDKIEDLDNEIGRHIESIYAQMSIKYGYPISELLRIKTIFVSIINEKANRILKSTGAGLDYAVYKLVTPMNPIIYAGETEPEPVTSLEPEIEEPPPLETVPNASIANKPEEKEIEIRDVFVPKRKALDEKAQWFYFLSLVEGDGNQDLGLQMVNYKKETTGVIEAMKKLQQETGNVVKDMEDHDRTVQLFHKMVRDINKNLNVRLLSSIQHSMTSLFFKKELHLRLLS